MGKSKTNPVVGAGCAEALSGERPVEDPTSADARAVLQRLDRLLDTPLARAARIEEGAATPWAIRWLSYPALVAAMTALVWTTIALGWNFHVVNSALLFGAMFAIFALEVLYPLDRTYSMTWRSFLTRDVKFMISNRLLGPANGLVVQLMTLWISEHNRGLMTNWPLWISIPAIVLICEFHGYWWHRLSHGNGNPVTRFMWRIHAAHHLPKQVYVMMQPVSNPLDTFSTFRPVLFFLFAPAPAAILAINAFNTLQGLVRHANLDLRTGWLNYLICGTELHRMHHSADEKQAKNYAAVLSLMDLLFGTLIYVPGGRPKSYGVIDPHLYPRSNQYWRTVLIPFRGTKAAEETV
jgi:sterol desaturase/sphingolipid hydroxylase (fatty acid hydroxylase superfamily)